MSAKFNDVRLDGELHNSAGIAFVADVVNACDEFTECPGSLRGFGFHKPKSKRKNRVDVMGCLPHVGFSQKTRTPMSGFEKCQTRRRDDVVREQDEKGKDHQTKGCQNNE